MNKKILSFFLCISLAFSMTACGSTDAQDAPDNSTDAQAKSESDVNDTQAQEALLSPDATDEELLELLKDEIQVVTDDDYIQMVTAFTEKTSEYAGQLYQLEGSYTVDDGTPCLTRIIVDGNNKTTLGMPLKYLQEEPEEGSWIRITGVVNEGEINGETTAVLEVAVSETIEEQGQAELLRQ